MSGCAHMSPTDYCASCVITPENAAAAARALELAKKNKAAAALGRKGGKAGTGASKVRGDSEYYRKIRAKRKKAKK